MRETKVTEKYEYVQQQLCDQRRQIEEKHWLEELEVETNSDWSEFGLESAY